VFAGGDVVTGPNTVVEAIAAGKKAAAMVDRYLRGEPLRRPASVRLPQIHVEPVAGDQAELSKADRAAPPSLPLEVRRRSFAEVELCLTAEDATGEARRCLRCDLEFTSPAKTVREQAAVGEEVR
jgi:NADH-quinone oxidoreductase subunit F